MVVSEKGRFETTRLGNPKLIDNECHQYVFQKMMSRVGGQVKKAWKCRLRHRFNCKVRVHTLGEVIVWRTMDGHNHNPEEAKPRQSQDEIQNYYESLSVFE